MKTDDKRAERIAEAFRKLRSKLNDEELDALDGLMEYLFSLDVQERQRVANLLITNLKEIIEDKRPVN